MFCENCGSKIEDGAAFCDNCGFPVKQTEAPVDSKKEKNKKLIAIIVIAVILAVAAVIIAVVCRNNDKKALENKLTGLTQKEIISFSYDDFNNDGKKEAFVVAGEGDEKQFEDSEIWYVSESSDKLIMDDATGSLNGILKENDFKYISYEIENDDSVGYSYIYGVEEKGEPVEPEISGKYQKVHQDGVKIVTGDGEIIGIKRPYDSLSHLSDDPKETFDTSKFIEPTQADFEKFNGIFSRFFERGKFDYQTCTVSEAMDHIIEDILCFNLSADCFEQISKDDPSAAEAVKRLDFEKNHGTETLRRLPEEKVELFLSESLNLKVDRNYKSDIGYSCYSNGYYYWISPGVGDYCPTISFISYEKLSDGRYKIKFKIEMLNDEDSYYIEVVAALKNIDGRRIWSFYKISRIKTIPSDAFEYNGNKYMLYTDSCDWSKARLNCQAVGGNIIRIDSKDEQEAIAGYLKKSGCEKDVWINLSYIFGENKWVYYDEFYESHESVYTNWASGQPVIATEEGWNCVMCAKDSGSMKAGQWYNVLYNKELYYICEWEKD